jgi:hypothetical protein
MTEAEVPQLHLTRDHIMAMTQLLNMLSQRLAEQRERRGRAAYSNAEHAARIAETQDNPVVRPMSDTERQQFTVDAGNPQVPQHGLSVATAPVGQEWGVRAVTPAGDAATVMCPNITEAARLADYLRAQNNPAVVNGLNELSEQIGHRVATETTSAATTEAAGTPSQQDPRRAARRSGNPQGRSRPGSTRCPRRAGRSRTRRPVRATTAQRDNRTSPYRRCRPPIRMRGSDCAQHGAHRVVGEVSARAGTAV